MAIQTGSIGESVTDRGTPIKKSGGEFDKNSFLKILSAQLSNLDPTQNQDSSAYVAQMAQFATMEQMQNLNTTMSDSAYQQMVGKKAIINEKYDDGSNVEGYITQVMKKSSGTFVKIVIDGKEEEMDVSNIIGIQQTTDTNTIANSKTALNSDFMAASELAKEKQNVVIATLDDNNKTVLVKGKVTGAYIDTVNGAMVKIKIEVLDSDGNSTTKIYNYEDIVRAGDLTDEEMDVELPTDTSDTSDTEDQEDSSTSQKMNTIATTTSNDTVKENEILTKIIGE